MLHVCVHTARITRTDLFRLMNILMLSRTIPISAAKIGVAARLMQKTAKKLGGALGSTVIPPPFNKNDSATY